MDSRSLLALDPQSTILHPPSAILHPLSCRLGVPEPLPQPKYFVERRVAFIRTLFGSRRECIILARPSADPCRLTKSARLRILPSRSSGLGPVPPPFEGAS